MTRLCAISQSQKARISGRCALRGPTISQYAMGESMRSFGSGSIRSPLARLSATSGSRASTTPWPVSAACTIW